MSFQRCMTLTNPKGGTMAATRSWYMKRTSRQRLRRFCHLVAPGGKMLGIVEQSFQQHRHQPALVSVRAVLDKRWPLPNLSHRQRSQRIDQPEQVAFVVVERQGCVVDAHQDVPTSLGDMGNAWWRALATVCQQQVTASHR